MLYDEGEVLFENIHKNKDSYYWERNHNKQVVAGQNKARTY